MSKKSVILVLQNKQENSTVDMAKIHIKSEKLTPFGGIFSCHGTFSRHGTSVVAHVPQDDTKQNKDIHKGLFIKTIMNILTDKLCYFCMYLARH